ncbi:MAG: CdaR family protein [Clostridia bacterium]|nr:CdaR family protein [Clostridia bacterium]
MKKTNNKLRGKVDAAKAHLENGRFKVGGLSIRLSSTLLYIACLLCAIFIWANVYESSAVTSSRVFHNVIVEIEGENSLSKRDLAVFELIDKTVSVTVSGAQNKVNDLSEDDVVAYVDVSDVESAGTVRLSVSVRGADRLDVTTSPSSIKTFVDKRVEVDVPLNISPTYSIMSGYDFTVSANMAEITVSGAKSIIDTVKEARVSPELGELSGSTTASSPIVLIDENGAELKSNYISADASTVVVKVDVFTKKTVPLTYSFKYGYIKNRNIKVTLNPSDITLVGDPAVLLDIDSLQLLEIDETKLPDSTEMVVSPSLPSGVKTLDSTNRFEVNIELLRYASKTIEIPVTNIQVKNPNGLKFNFENTVYELDYIVDSGSAKKVTAGSFGVVIDLSNVPNNISGSYNITPSVTALYGDYTLYPVNLEQIKIDIIGN